MESAKATITIKLDDVRRGVVVRHHSGNVYTILGILNSRVEPTEKFPYTVHYIGANGNEWARPLKDFMQKFTVLYDGTTKAP